MSSLLLRLSGPMQSWGTQSRFFERDSGFEPSKSGVIGLVCAAMGVKRSDEETIAELATLEMGVRVDKEGRLERDFHTVGGGEYPGVKTYGVSKADMSSRQAVVSQRYYLADAKFLVALGGRRILLEKIEQALQSPVWPIFLGRKSFVPGEPVWLHDGMCELSPEEALKSYPWLRTSQNECPARLRLVLECSPEEGYRRMDQPISFEPHNRRYGERYVKVAWVDTDCLRKS